MKKLICLVIILSFTCLFSGCANNDEEKILNESGSKINDEGEEKTNDSENYTELTHKDVDIQKTMEEMQELVKGDKLVDLTEEEINNKYDFGDYKYLEKRIATNESDEFVNEIAIVKVDSTEHTEDILRIMMNRLIDLKEKFADNEEMTTLLNTEGKFIVKEKAGIVVMIIADNAQEIEAQFDKNITL